MVIVFFAFFLTGIYLLNDPSTPIWNLASYIRKNQPSVRARLRLPVGHWRSTPETAACSGGPKHRPQQGVWRRGRDGASRVSGDWSGDWVATGTTGYDGPVGGWPGVAGLLHERHASPQHQRGRILRRPEDPSGSRSIFVIAFAVGRRRSFLP